MRTKNNKAAKKKTAEKTRKFPEISLHSRRGISHAPYTPLLSLIIVVVLVSSSSSSCGSSRFGRERGERSKYKYGWSRAPSGGAMSEYDPGPSENRLKMDSFDTEKNIIIFSLSKKSILSRFSEGPGSYSDLAPPEGGPTPTLFIF